MPKRTLDNRKNDHPAFCHSLNEGKVIADANAAESLYRRATGEVVFVEKRAKNDKTGRFLPGNSGWGGGSQARLHADNRDEAEDENEHGGDVCDEPHDDSQLDGPDSEPSLGWTEHVDQTLAARIEDRDWHAVDGEPDLGFVGHGTGWRKGEETDDREGGDELSITKNIGPTGGDHGIWGGASPC